MKKKFYDNIFIGAGPSTIFAIIKLDKLGYYFKNKRTLIIEKGKSLNTRTRKEVVNGFAGAGCFSDCKLTSGLDVGGSIPNMTQDELDKYSDDMLNTFNTFKSFTSNPENLKWDKTVDLKLNDGLEWVPHRTSHVGTDNGTLIFKVMEDYIKGIDGVDILFRKEVENVTYHGYSDKLNGDAGNLYISSVLKTVSDYPYEITLSDGTSYNAKNLIIATGQKNTLPENIIQNFNLSTEPRAFQLGIRVEDRMNSAYERLIEANYDFKIQKTYNYDNGVTVRVRTFCVNSGNAHVCEEKNDEGFSCFNGHAFKNGDKTDMINYGIICETSGISEYNLKENQIELMKRINADKNFMNDNFQEDGTLLKGRPLINDFFSTRGDNSILEKYYPKEVMDALKKFIISLISNIPMDNAKYFYPEVKLSGNRPALSENFETEKKGLFMIGDASITRGIVKSTYTGTKLAEYLFSC